MSRHTYFIRAVATITGDITIGYAMASACVWVIQSAALGLFLSFMLWLLAIALSLAMSQHILHPAVAVLLSDRKLDPSLAVTLIRCCGTTRHGLQRLRTTRRPSRRPRASDEALERAKAALVALAEHPREQGAGVTVTRFWKAGNVDYKRVVELRGVDLEAHRGKGREEVRVTTAT